MDKPVPTPKDLATQPLSSGQETIEAAVTRVESLVDEPIAEHVEAFEHAYRVLQEYLNEAVDG